MDDQRTNRASVGIRVRKLLLAMLIGWLIGVFSYGVSLRGDKSFSWPEFAYTVFFVGFVLGMLLAFAVWINRLGFRLWMRALEAIAKNAGQKK